MRLLLAADIGGTKTLLGLFKPTASRPTPVAVRAFGTVDYADLPSMIAEFVDGESVKPGDIEAASFGVAGPVLDDAATLTNVPWKVDARSVRSRCAGGDFGRCACPALRPMRRSARDVRRSLRRRSRQPGAARRLDGRRVRRRRHRAQDSAGARQRHLHSRLSRQAAARWDAVGD